MSGVIFGMTRMMSSAGSANSRRHSRGRTKLYPTSDHGKGDRWQVRWRDDTGNQRKRNFPKRDGTDPEKHASAFDAKVKSALHSGSYIDPRNANTSLRDFSERWRKARTHDLATAERIEGEFRIHVYADPDRPGVTPSGASAIGQYPIGVLAKRPSIMQAWISGIKLGPSSARQVPKVAASEIMPWSAGQVEAMADELPDRLSVIPYFGAACALRQGEVFALASDDLDFLRRNVHAEVQIKCLRGATLVFAPIKNGKIRDVPVPDEVLPLFSEHIRAYPPVPVTLPWKTPDGKPVTRSLLFTWPPGEAIVRQRFNKLWAKGRKASGIPEERGNGFHVTRHTAATTWLGAGVSLAKVAAYLGDTEETVLSVYAHFLPSDDDRAREVMNAFFARAGERSCAQNGPGEAT